jgi:LPXTG-motif cell wall-anchored protein
MIAAAAAAHVPAHVPANWPGWLVIIGFALLVLAGLGRWRKS